MREHMLLELLRIPECSVAYLTRESIRALTIQRRSSGHFRSGQVDRLHSVRRRADERRSTDTGSALRHGKIRIL